MWQKKKNKRGAIGDIELSDMKGRKGNPIICIKKQSFDDGAILHVWEDYETHILRTRVGMDLHSHDVHTLQYFIDALAENKTAIKGERIYDSDIRATNLAFIINSLKQLMGAKSPYTRKETTKIYINYVRKAIEPLNEAVKRLEEINEEDYSRGEDEEK
jgi:hypothetical protein